MNECPLCDCPIAVNLNLNDVMLIIEDDRILITYHDGEGMEIGKEELNNMLLDYIKENF